MFKQPYITQEVSEEALKKNPKGTSKIPLSLPGGQAITLPIALTQSPVEIHHAPLGVLDEVYIWASNYSDAAANVLISIGSTSFAAGSVIEAQLTGKNGLVLVYPGIPHNNVTILAKSSGAAAINLVGFVVRNYSINNSDSNFGYYNSGD
jgi:hypothetical protein